MAAGNVAFAVPGDTLFLAARGDGLYAFDLSTPADPQPAGRVSGFIDASDYTNIEAVFNGVHAQGGRVAVARALMAGPDLLLMDEPSLGLAPLMVAEVARIIREINASGISIILVEQNARMALKLASRAYVLEVGRITLTGDATELLHDD